MFSLFFAARSVKVYLSHKYVTDEFFRSGNCYWLPSGGPPITSSKRKKKLRSENSFQKPHISHLDQNLMDICPSSAITEMDEQTILDYIPELFSGSSEFQSSTSFDDFLNGESFASPFITSFSGVRAENRETSTKENVTRLSPHPSSPIMSKMILVSHLPLTVDNQWLRAIFPGCRKIIFKKNYWNKNLRL